MQKLATLGMISFGVLTGIYLSISLHSPAIAQMGPSTQNGGDALWHLPKFGSKAGPRCSNW
jgi:hypothetical protein